MKCALLLTLVVPLVLGDQTGMTQDLNKQIESGSGAYNKGKGILVRTPDFFNGGKNVVVPATFWVNDIITPSQAYPEGNPWCPHGDSDGFFSAKWQKCLPREGPWGFATVAAVISGNDIMNRFFRDFEHIQDPTWGWGVFYATDANAADQRCKREGDGWNCPGGRIDSTGKFHENPSQQGAGFFPMGNPAAGLGGGGAGCHFDKNAQAIDQADAFTTLPGFNGTQNLVEDADCQCNYAFNQDWSGWVWSWIENNQPKPAFQNRNWLGKSGKKAPTWAIDAAICWVNNPKDMISMQNAIYRARHQWNNGLIPVTNLDGREYWGWNEVPVTKVVVDDPASWTAVMIKLPTDCYLQNGGSNNLDCLSTLAKQQLEKDLDSFVSKGKLLLGKANLNKRPGSNIVLVRELQARPGEYERQFFCQAWTSNSSKFVIKFDAVNNTDTGACFLDTAPSTIIV
jgi:hypothetical protein